MLFIISPAKKQNFSHHNRIEFSTPIFLDKADNLAQRLKKKSPGNLMKLFQVSEDLAHLNYDRFQNWKISLLPEVGEKALYAFQGHVYQKIDIKSLKKEEIEYANKYLRILSGMYGLLKPTDLILPHRLEMGTKWPSTKRNLYGYWSKLITKEINNTMEELETDILINLASQEYFKVIDKNLFKGKIINIEFRERRSNGSFMVISIYAKQARGLMCRYAFQHKIHHPEDLIGFDSEGYLYNNELSDDGTYVFTRG